MKIRFSYLVVVALTFLSIITVLPSVAEYSSPNSTLIVNSRSSLALKPQATPILEQGKQLYDAGKLAESALVWEQAVKIFKQRGEQRNQALGYNYLAIVYLDLGKVSAAREAIAQAQNILKAVNYSLLSAQVLNTQGIFQLNTGNSKAALETWQQAEKLYRSQKDVTGILLSQINQAQALQSLRYYRIARTQLNQISQDLAKRPDSILKASGLRSLGVTLQVLGDLERSQQALSESLGIAKRLNSTTDIRETFAAL